MSGCVWRGELIPRIGLPPSSFETALGYARGSPGNGARIPPTPSPLIRPRVVNHAAIMAFTPLSRKRKSFLCLRVTDVPGCISTAASATMSRYRAIGLIRPYSLTRSGKEYARLPTAVATSLITRGALKGYFPPAPDIPLPRETKRAADFVIDSDPHDIASFGGPQLAHLEALVSPWMLIRKDGANQSFRPLGQPL